jgi:hypothetical protein
MSLPRKNVILKCFWCIILRKYAIERREIKPHQSPLAETAKLKFITTELLFFNFCPTKTLTKQIGKQQSGFGSFDGQHPKFKPLELFLYETHNTSHHSYVRMRTTLLYQISRDQRRSACRFTLSEGRHTNNPVPSLLALLCKNIGKMHSLKYPKILKVFFTLQHERWRQQLGSFIATAQRTCTLTSVLPQRNTKGNNGNQGQRWDVIRSNYRKPTMISVPTAAQHVPTMTLSCGVPSSSRKTATSTQTYGRAHYVFFTHARARRTKKKIYKCKLITEMWDPRSSQR